MNTFTSETPLGQSVQELLYSAPNGLTLHEIRRKLRLERGQHIDERNLQELLRNTRAFSALSNGKYVLAGTQVNLVQKDNSHKTIPNQHISQSAPLFLVHLPQVRNDYVVFDLETTGLDPERDLIIQIAALKVAGGIPVAMRNWYINPGSVVIPYTLKVTLGIADNPTISEQIYSAPPFVEIAPKFLDFVGNLPMVAHNARFDASFLQAKLGVQGFSNAVIDTMELALLIAPGLPNHQLKTITESLGIEIEKLQEEWDQLDIERNIAAHEISGSTLHNAVTDVYLLYRVFEKIREKLTAKEGAYALLAELLPELFNQSAQFAGVSTEHIRSIRGMCKWIEQVNTDSSYREPLNAVAYLTEYLEHKGLKTRPGQVEMQQFLVEALAKDHYSMIEAPTGTGKTLAYLSASVCEALIQQRKIVLSTAYRNLQDQLLAEIAELQQRGGIPFRSQLLKGVSNYLCWSKIVRYLQEGDPQNSKTTRSLILSERFVLAHVILWLPESRHGTADELSYWLLETIPHARQVVHQLRASAACNPNLQEHCCDCPMPAAYAYAQCADIVVINHALWLSAPKRMPEFAQLILDEAHTLEDVATGALTQEVSSQTLNELLWSLYDPFTERGLLPRLRAIAKESDLVKAIEGGIASVRQVLPLVEDFGPAMVQFIRRSVGKLDHRYSTSFRLEGPPAKLHQSRWEHLDLVHRQLFGLHLKYVLDAIGKVYQALQANESIPFKSANLSDTYEAIEKLMEQRQLAYDLVKVDDSKQVYWLEIGPPQQMISSEEDTDPKGITPEWWAFKRTPTQVSEALQPFYEKLSSVNFVSATLSVRGNDFSLFVERLGLASRLERSHIHQLPPALSYHTNVLLGLADYLTYAPLQNTLESFKEELAMELSLFLQITEGRALGLFTARQRMEEIARRIEPDLARSGVPLYIQEADVSKKKLLDAFRERTESVLFGLRSFWEGVDAPGETLSFVLMEKLPFALLTDPVHKARAETLNKAGKSEFDDYMLPLMLLQFKQGFGRLMRREDDRGAVVLFDRRIHRKPYKYDLLRSLPGFLPRNEEDERSRLRFYASLAQAFPGLINQERMNALLIEVPEEMLLNIDSILARYLLPQTLSSEEYDAVRPNILAALHEVFKLDSFRLVGGKPLQESVIRHVLMGNDVLGVLPTGAGKSLTFQLPALLRHGVTLVFSPLIALMKDQVANLNARKIEVVGAIYSGQSSSERDDVFERMQRGRIRLVYISPERLRDPQLLAAIKQTNVIQIVIDEAHCVYMWGASFRPDFLYLPRIFNILGKRPPIVALTATATLEMQQSIIDSLQLHNPVRVVGSVDRPELQFIVYNSKSRYTPISSRNDRIKQLLRILQAADAETPPILIYVATTVEADQIARYLQVAGYAARAYHGKMDAADRSSVQEMFMDEHINIVVCTKAFGMGIDKPNIRYVIHFNMPGDLESYFQEAGRAGRDGQTAYCILLYHAGDIETQQFFIDNSTPDEETINQVLNYLRRLPGNTLYLDPEEVQTLLGIEDVQLRVAIHHLESQTFLTRSADFSLRGSLLFQKEPQEILHDWQQAQEPNVILLGQLIAATKWSAYYKIEIDLRALAQQVSATPESIEQVFIRLGQREEAIYRPWQRGLVLVKDTNMDQKSSVSAGALAADSHRVRMKQKLNDMITYATTNQHCRRALILRYFGEQPIQQCDGCDVCKPKQEWPWSLITSRDFATPDSYLDPAFVLLEIVKWNLDRAKKYSSPLGTGMLFAILKGDAYSVTRYETDPHMKRWRLQQVRACPYWGVFATLKNRDVVLEKIQVRLLQEKYLELGHQNWSQGGQYEYLKLAQRGIEQLTSGKLLQWEMAK